MNMKSWMLPIALLIVEIGGLLIFKDIPLISYLFVWGIGFSITIIVQYTGSSFKMFGQGALNHKIHRVENYDVAHSHIVNMTKSKELSVPFSDILFGVFGAVNIIICFILV